MFEISIVHPRWIRLGATERPERAPFADGDLLRATLEKYAAAGSSYIGYSGRFFIDEGKKTLSHEMAVSFFPNWLGQRQVRLVKCHPVMAIDLDRLFQQFQSLENPLFR